MGSFCCWGERRGRWRALFRLGLLWWSAVGGSAAVPAVANPPPLILISIDGFRWDYMERYAAEAPTLRRLRSEGASVKSLVPVFPSNTFPNHYTLVTGLYPANHGIVNNDFFDPKSGTIFRFNQPGAAGDSRWWGGEPIWVTAILQGQTAATAFWVGSETEVKGIRPTFWQKFNYRIPFSERLDELIRWLKLPPAERPSVVTFYLEETNGAGHRYGPDSAEVAAAVQLSDTRISEIIARLAAEDIESNLIVASDHGMTATSLDRVIILEDHVARDSVQVDADGSAMALRPLRGDARSLVRAFQKVRHVRAYLAEELPAHLRLAGNDRISPVWVLPDEGWHMVTRATYDRLRANYRVNGYLQGDHGYDPALPNMHGILIAHGPAFRRGARAGSVENVHLYNLMCAVLGLRPAANDGDDRLVRAFLRE